MTGRPIQPTGGVWDDERLADAYCALTARPAPADLTEATLAATALAATALAARREGSGWRALVWRRRRGPHAARAGSFAGLSMVAAVVLGAGLLLVATNGGGRAPVGAPVTRSGQATPGSVVPTQANALAVEWKIPDSSITLSPPGNAVPAISRDSAYGLCLIGVASCAPSNPTAIQLASATDTGSRKLDPSGTLVPLMSNRLVWAISWLGIACPPGGGGPATRPSPLGANTPVATVQPLCDEVAFVDAHSGAFIFTFTGSHH